MIRTCLIFLLFSAALSFGLWGIPLTVAWTKTLIGETLMLRIAKGMMFVGFVGFFTILSMALLSILGYQGKDG